MAGSRRWFGYTDDQDVVWAVQLDESTAESTDLGFTSPIPEAATGRVISKGVPIKMRYVNVFRVVNGQEIRRKFYVGNVAANGFDPTKSSITVDGVVWGTSSTRGERRVRVPQLDTAQKDGDTEANVANNPV